MTVTVSCIGGSSQFFPGGKGKVEVSFFGPKTILHILEEIRFSPDLVMFALVNGEKAELTATVGDGDELVLVSPIMGG